MNYDKDPKVIPVDEELMNHGRLITKEVHRMTQSDNEVDYPLHLRRLVRKGLHPPHPTMRPDRVEEKLKLLQPTLPASQWNGLRMQYYFEKDWRKKRELENHDGHASGNQSARSAKTIKFYCPRPREWS